MRFEFATATRIIFGQGTITEAAATAGSFGDNALVVTGRLTERAASLLDGLKHHGVAYHLFNITGEPTVEMIQQGCAKARKAGCNMVIAMGGGSVIDAGKAIAGHMTNPGDLYDYLEVVGKGRPLLNAAATFIAIPTTAGTGAEVTANAVLQSVSHGVKVSMRSPLLLPKVAIIDPLVGLSMPKELTAATGMDALTQLIEAYVSPMGNPLTDSLCREGIQRAARSLLVAYHTGDDRKAREDMALAALFSGMALTNAKLGAVHGIAGPLGGMLPIPHGVICARLLPLVMRANLKALKKRQESTLALERYTDVARLLTGNKEALAADGAAWVETGCDQMNISGLSQYGVDQQLIANLVPKAQKASSMRGNPIELTVEELTNILMAAGG